MLHELQISLNKCDFSDRLVKGYDKVLPTLKNRTVTMVAIQLCQNMELKKEIIFESELQRLHEDRIEKITECNRLIIQRSAEICEKIPLPLELKNLLTARLQSVTLQLFSWNRLQAKFDLSPLFADSLLTPLDWTAEGRLDERKIAERLVRDERISSCKRYKMACFHCLISFIYTLWNQISNDALFHHGECTLVKMWSKKLAREDEYLDMGHFWRCLFSKGVMEGSSSTMFYAWNQEPIGYRSTMAMCEIVQVFDGNKRHFTYFNQLSSPASHMDTLYFLLTQTPKRLMLALFYKALLDTRYNILLIFVQWPYLDSLIPIIKELWAFLPVVKYGNLLLTLAHNYSDEGDYNIRGIGYVDYDYGDLMIELLEESPDHFKRYLFSDNHQTDTNPVKILYLVIRKNTLNFRNIRIFQHIWHHATLVEKRSFLKSEYGELFCCCLARKENWELLNSLLKECLPEEDVAMLQSKILKLLLNEVIEKP